MFKMLVAIGPCSTSSSTGMAKIPKLDTTSAPGSTLCVTVARVAPKIPSQTTGRNWPKTLAKKTLDRDIALGRNREQSDAKAKQEQTHPIPIAVMIVLSADSSAQP